MIDEDHFMDPVMEMSTRIENPTELQIEDLLLPPTSPSHSHSNLISDHVNGFGDTNMRPHPLVNTQVAHVNPVMATGSEHESLMLDKFS